MSRTWLKGRNRGSLPRAGVVVSASGTKCPAPSRVCTEEIKPEGAGLLQKRKNLTQNAVWGAQPIRKKSNEPQLQVWSVPRRNFEDEEEEKGPGASRRKTKGF